MDCSRRAGLSLLVLFCFSTTGCDSGDRSQSSQDGAESDAGLILLDIKYGRLLDEGEGPRVVSPFTTVKTDPITGLVIPGTLRALSPSIDQEELVSLGLGPGYVPRVLPRNAVLILEFNDLLDADSVRLDELAAGQQVVRDGNIRLRIQGQQGQGIPLQACVEGSRLLLNPVVEGTVGLPASPVNFGADGAARASATGFLRLRLTSGSDAIRSASGIPLSLRPDGLGEGTQPIGINPGNTHLDFTAQHFLIPGLQSFSGFLPDETAPRLIRSVQRRGVLQFAAGDAADALSLIDVDASFSAVANQGRGEWQGRRLTLRPGEADEEIHVVDFNDRTTLVVKQPFARPPQDGNAYELTRAEFFEPDPANPIDSLLFDPNNPENGRNAQLANFVVVREIDAALQPVRSLDLRDALPPNCELQLSFNEPMAKNSFRPWETFTVTVNPPVPGEEKLAHIFFNREQTRATIRPVRQDASGAFHLVGWGPGVQPLRLSLQTIPSSEFLRERLQPEEVLTFQDKGHQGLTDLGGRPLAVASSRFVTHNPRIEFSEPFLTDERNITAELSSAHDLGDWGVLVHRFQGRPRPGLDVSTGRSGVLFGDQANVYAPIPDVNLAVNGYLAGPPVSKVRKVHDDFFPPLDGQFGAISNGVQIPLSSVNPVQASTGRWTYDGMRFQHVYRDHDCSPGTELAGTLLDLYQVSWSPIGGNVNTDVYDQVAVYAAHSSQRPITRQNGGFPDHPRSGLDRPFDFDTWKNSQLQRNGLPFTGLVCDFADVTKVIDSENEGPNYFGELVKCAETTPQKPYRITQSNIFTILGSSNSWHPWPSFTQAMQYNNGGIPAGYRGFRQSTNQEVTGNPISKNRPWQEKRTAGLINEGGDSLLLEYRIQPQNGLISRANGFTYSFGILTNFQPMFRAFSAGTPDNPLFPDDLEGDLRARCADGPHIANGNISTFGDNSRYFAIFDYEKTTAIITSPFVAVVGTRDAIFEDVMTHPPLAGQPAGTLVELDFSGANGPAGNNATDFTGNPSDHTGKNYLAFRVKLVGNTQTLLTPNFDTLAIPYRRP